MNVSALRCADKRGIPVHSSSGELCESHSTLPESERRVGLKIMVVGDVRTVQYVCRLQPTELNQEYAHQSLRWLIQRV
jgi:hypothetical protein